MALEIEGKLKEMLPERSGEGRNGHWSVQDFVIEVPGQYPRDVAFSVWNNRIDLSTLVIGESLKVSFDAQSRKGQTGGYFTSLTAWKIEKVGVGAPAGAPVATAPVAGAAPSGPVEQTQAGGDDLPF